MLLESLGWVSLEFVTPLKLRGNFDRYVSYRSFIWINQLEHIPNPTLFGRLSLNVSIPSRLKLSNSRNQIVLVKINFYRSPFSTIGRYNLIV